MKTYLPHFSAVILVLQPTPANEKAIPLEDWLSSFNPSPIWLSLSPKLGIVKALAVLPNYQLYPQLMEAIALRLSQNSFISWQGNFFTISGVQSEDFSLYKVSLSFRCEQGVSHNFVEDIHQIILQNFARTNGDLDSQGFTAFYQPYSSVEGVLHIAILQKQLLTPLLWGISQHFKRNMVLTSFQGQDFIELSKTPCQQIVKLRFSTPTSFKQHNVIQNFPLPELVFNSLWRKWNYFTSSELHFPSIDWQGLVCGYDLKTEIIQLKHSSEIGCVGWVKYQFKDTQQRQIASILANFANFAGVGRKTTMGMGQTQFKERDYE